MKNNWRNALTGLGLLVGLITLGTTAPSCVVRAGVSPIYTVDEAPPDPAPRYQNPAPRRGYVWINGHYERRGQQWVWKSGQWQRERSGQNWQAARWEQRGNQWVFVRGTWVNGPVVRGGQPRDTRPPVRDNRDHTRPPVRDNRDHRDNERPPVRDNRTTNIPPGAPRSAPPSPRYKKVAARRGFVWVRGHYEWSGGQWNWRDGHWERMKAGYRWQEGRWDDRGGYWVWVEGGWTK